MPQCHRRTWKCGKNTRVLMMKMRLERRNCGDSHLSRILELPKNSVPVRYLHICALVLCKNTSSLWNNIFQLIFHSTRKNNTDCLMFTQSSLCSPECVEKDFQAIVCSFSEHVLVILDALFCLRQISDFPAGNILV